MRVCDPLTRGRDELGAGVSAAWALYDSCHVLLGCAGSRRGAGASNACGELIEKRWRGDAASPTAFLGYLSHSPRDPSLLGRLNIELFMAASGVGVTIEGFVGVHDAYLRWYRYDRGISGAIT